MRGVSHALPSIQQVIDLTIACGQLTNPAIDCAGIAVNTQKLGEDEARALLEALATRLWRAGQRSDPLWRQLDCRPDRRYVGDGMNNSKNKACNGHKGE
jgi:uncharacterized NAD-dependent epimerase/dehydratase family protein